MQVYLLKMHSYIVNNIYYKRHGLFYIYLFYFIYLVYLFYRVIMTIKKNLEQINNIITLFIIDILHFACGFARVSVDVVNLNVLFFYITQEQSLLSWWIILCPFLFPDNVYAKFYDDRYTRSVTTWETPIYSIKVEKEYIILIC